MANSFDAKKGTENSSEHKKKLSLHEKIAQSRLAKTHEKTEQHSQNQEKDIDLSGELTKKEEQIKALALKLSELENREKRTLADFVNYRQRMQNEKSGAYDNGAMDAITKLLAILDNLERALQAVPESEKENNYYKGTEMIIKQFLLLLSELNVQEIKVNPGDDFNHDLHCAVAHVEDENFGENKITDVFEKGYKYKDKVIRYTKVRVAN